MDIQINNFPQSITKAASWNYHKKLGKNIEKNFENIVFIIYDFKCYVRVNLTRVFSSKYGLKVFTKHVSISMASISGAFNVSKRLSASED